MRRTICIALLIVMTDSAFSQQTPFAKDDYLQKSKHQKTAAWILLGGGATLSVVGLAVGLNSAVDELGSRIATGEDDKSLSQAQSCFTRVLVQCLEVFPCSWHRGAIKERQWESHFFQNRKLPGDAKNCYLLPLISGAICKV